MTKWWWTRGGVAVVGIGFLALYSAAESCRTDYSKHALALGRTAAIQQSTGPIPSAAVIEPAAPSVIVSRASTATLLDGQLYSCTTLSAEESEEVSRLVMKTLDASPQAVADDELSTWLAGGKSVVGDSLNKKQKGSGLEVRPKGTTQPLTKLCADQFARPVIASCAISANEVLPNGMPPVKFSAKTLYYLPTDDLVMSQCIAVGGDWQEAAHDSSEYLYAKSQESGRRFLKSVGQQ